MNNLYPIRFLEWDTRFFGQKMGAVDFSQNLCPCLTRDNWQSTIENARREGYHFLFCAIDSTMHHHVNIILQSGALIGDVLLTFHRDLSLLRGNVSETSEYVITEAEEQDLPALQEIAGESFANSRFYQDPRFGKEKGSRLYQNWLLESFQKEKILTARSGSEIAGFVSYGNDPATKTMIIRLLATKPQGRGRGVGGILIGRLVDLATSNGCETISVGTQINNYGAVRFYEKMGFRVVNARYRFHLWLNENSVDNQ